MTPDAAEENAIARELTDELLQDFIASPLDWSAERMLAIEVARLRRRLALEAHWCNKWRAYACGNGPEPTEENTR